MKEHPYSKSVADRLIAFLKERDWQSVTLSPEDAKDFVAFTKTVNGQRGRIMFLTDTQWDDFSNTIDSALKVVAKTENIPLSLLQEIILEPHVIITVSVDMKILKMLFDLTFPIFPSDKYQNPKPEFMPPIERHRALKR